MPNGEDSPDGPASSPPEASALTDVDRTLLESLAGSNEWMRSVLCTLARRGLRLRRDEPARAREIIDALSAHPLYKGGHFLFDLLEWEDFMTDGPPPPIVPSVLDSRSLLEIADFLRSVRASIDGETAGSPTRPELQLIATAHPDDELPPLEPGLYLYPDVVLGVVSTLASSLPPIDTPKS